MALELFITACKTERQVLSNNSSILNMEVYLPNLKTTGYISHGLCNFKCAQGFWCTLINPLERRHLNCEL